MSGKIAVIALGTNLAHQGLAGAALLRAAIQALESRALLIERISSFWTTPAWPDPADPTFTNAVLLAQSPFDAPETLLAELLAVEQMFGRRRGVRHAPRTLDLDLLDFEGLIRQPGETAGNGAGEGGRPVLELPHPRLHSRAFVLGPLAEIAPDWRHPVFGETATALLAALRAPAAHGD
jgi:2-amino-4-hydroxy-6-hydroxymethyldihydropteridine diphosphokinase